MKQEIDEEKKYIYFQSWLIERDEIRSGTSDENKSKNKWSESYIYSYWLCIIIIRQLKNKNV